MYILVYTHKNLYILASTIVEYKIETFSVLVNEISSNVIDTDKQESSCNEHDKIMCLAWNTYLFCEQIWNHLVQFDLQVVSSYQPYVNLECRIKSVMWNYLINFEIKINTANILINKSFSNYDIIKIMQ